MGWTKGNVQQQSTLTDAPTSSSGLRANVELRVSFTILRIPPMSAVLVS